MKKKQMNIVLWTLVVVVFLIGLSSFISYAKFSVVNPFSTASGLVKVIFTDTDYVEIQQYPKVIIAKPDTSLDEYMENEGGYKRVEEEQLGSLHMFSNGDHSEYIMYSVNNYFSKWRWQE